MKGDYDEYSKNVYKLPFDERLNLKPKPAPKHYDSMVNALDFAMPEGTPVYAAREGIVVKVKDDSDVGGPDELLRPNCNIICIKHDNEEYSVYVHLKYKGSYVKEQQKVKQGDLIGYSGKTGFTTYPHLHFGIYKMMEDGKRIYLVVRFKIKDKEIILKSPK